MTITIKKKVVERRSASNTDDDDDVTRNRNPSTTARSRRVEVVSSGDLAVTIGSNPSPSTSARSRRVVISGDTAVTAVSKDDEDGYNSMDEHHDSAKEDSSVEEIVRKEAIFESMLQETKGFVINKMLSDGACMFRAVADQIYGDQDMHSIVRQHCIDYMVKNEDFFSKYITENFTSYISRKRFDHTFGNHIELHALSELYNRRVEVYQYSCEPINTFSSRSQTDDVYPPIRLSYHGNIHYNSIVDPINPSVGIGLGLPRYELAEAKKESGTLSIEKSIIDNSVKLTDWEATDKELVASTAFESYKQWLTENEVPCTSTSYEETLSDDIPSSCESRKSSLARKSSPSLERQRHKRRRTEKDRSKSNGGCGGLTNIKEDDSYPTVLDRSKNNDDCDEALMVGLAQSQQEYLTSQDKHRKSFTPSTQLHVDDDDTETNVEIERNNLCAHASLHYNYDTCVDGEDELIAALAQSQLEYLHSLNKTGREKKE